MGQEGKVDYLLFKNHLEHELRQLDIDERQLAEIAPLIPFSKTIIDLEEARRKMEPIDSAKTAALLTSLKKQIDDTRKLVEAGLRPGAEGAAVIKVCASGGVLSEVDHPVHQQFTDAELRTIVEVAGLADRVVAAHCHGKPGIMAALRAGVATIEHGTYLDEEACDAMRETGAILVPTRTIIENILAHLDKVPPYAAAKLTAVADIHADMVRMAIECGVTIAMGTDLGLTGLDLPGAWGTNGTELQHLVALGMTPHQAIEAATATAPRTLGPQAPRSGLLAEGYDADLITVDGDPLADISLLAEPDRITAVWVGGRQVKGNS